MKNGDQVKVYPHGQPQLAAAGKVALISANQLSIAVGFMEKPPFAIIHPEPGDAIGPLAVTAEFGLMLLAGRQALHSEPWGPWVELFGGGHFEIEEPK